MNLLVTNFFDKYFFFISVVKYIDILLCILKRTQRNLQCIFFINVYIDLIIDGKQTTITKKKECVREEGWGKLKKSPTFNIFLQSRKKRGK